MNSQDRQEEQLLIAFENIKRLTTRTNWVDSLPQGEFLMMYVIHVIMRKEKSAPKEPQTPGVMVSRLSELLGISRPTASQTVSALEEKGYVERTMSEADRRVTYIGLTGHGQKEFDQRMARYTGIMNEIIEKVGRDEVDRLIATCERLRYAVEEVKLRLSAEALELEAEPAAADV